MLQNIKDMVMYDDLIMALEARRKKVYPWIIATIVALVFGILLIFISPIFFVIAMVAVLIVSLAVITPIRREYADFYKTTIVKKIFEERVQNVNYQPKGGLSEHYIKSTGFMQMGNRYHTEDLISASYKNVNFSRADVKIEDESSDGENSTTTVYFMGRWIILDFNKRFSSDIQLIQKGFSYSKKKSTIFTRKEERRHKVEFENEAFNQRFTCYCENEQDAFYIINPQLMEALMQYTAVADGYIMLGFKENQVHLAIKANKDTLEPSLLKEVTFQRDIVPVMYEVGIITSFIDILNIDRNIYKTND